MYRLPVDLVWLKSIRVFHLHAQLLLPNCHEPKQNWTDSTRITLKIPKLTQPKSHEQMSHPVRLVVLDVEESVRREDVCLVLRDEHGGHPPDEELAALEGEGAPEVRPLLVAHNALQEDS